MDTAPSLPHPYGQQHYDGNYLTAVERSRCCSAFPRRFPDHKLRDYSRTFGGAISECKLSPDYQRQFLRNEPRSSRLSPSGRFPFCRVTAATLSVRTLSFGRGLQNRGN